MVPDADQVKQILAGIAGQIDEQNSLPPLLSLSVRLFALGSTSNNRSRLGFAVARGRLVPYAATGLCP